MMWQYLPPPTTPLPWLGVEHLLSEKRIWILFKNFVHKFLRETTYQNIKLWQDPQMKQIKKILTKSCTVRVLFRSSSSSTVRSEFGWWRFHFTQLFFSRLKYIVEYLSVKTKQSTCWISDLFRVILPGSLQKSKMKLSDFFSRVDCNREKVGI